MFNFTSPLHSVRLGSIYTSPLHDILFLPKANSKNNCLKVCVSLILKLCSLVKK